MGCGTCFSFASPASPAVAAPRALEQAGVQSLQEETATGRRKQPFVCPKGPRSVGSLLLSQLGNPTSPVQLWQHQPVLPNPRSHLGIGH